MTMPCAQHPVNPVIYANPTFEALSGYPCAEVPQAQEGCESLLQKSQAQLQQAKRAGRHQAA